MQIRHVVGVRTALLDVVNVVRRHELQAEFLRPRNETAVDLRLLGNAVILEFEVKIFRAEGLLEPVDRLTRLLGLVLVDVFGNLARQTARKNDQSLLVRGEDLLVDPGFVIIALQMRLGDQLDEILVAGFILGEEHEVIVHIPASAGGFLVEPAAGGDVHFAADDWFDPLVPRRLVKIDRPVQHPVVRDRQGRELQVMGLVHQPVEPASAIKQRVLGVQMQMDKFRVRRHALI